VKKHIGILKFGESRPAPKMVEVDVTFDKVAEKRLFQSGMKLLKKDRQAVISYAIQEALKQIAKS
jgi:hypothetical protein